MKTDEQFIQELNQNPELKQKEPKIELTGKEFRFIGNHLEYFPIETLIGNEEKGFYLITASYYPREFLKDDWNKLILFKYHGILARQNKDGFLEYIISELFESEKVDFEVMCEEMRECISQMPTMFDANQINKHNWEGFEEYIVKQQYKKNKRYFIPPFAEFDVVKMEIDEWYIGDETRPTIGERGDYLAIYNGNPIRLTEEDRAEMKWEKPITKEKKAVLKKYIRKMEDVLSFDDELKKINEKYNAVWTFYVCGDESFLFDFRPMIVELGMSLKIVITDEEIIKSIRKRFKIPFMKRIKYLFSRDKELEMVKGYLSDWFEKCQWSMLGVSHTVFVWDDGSGIKVYLHVTADDKYLNAIKELKDYVLIEGVTNARYK